MEQGYPILRKGSLPLSLECWHHSGTSTILPASHSCGCSQHPWHCSSGAPRSNFWPRTSVWVIIRWWRWTLGLPHVRQALGATWIWNTSRSAPVCSCWWPSLNRIGASYLLCGTPALSFSFSYGFFTTRLRLCILWPERCTVLMHLGQLFKTTIYTWMNCNPVLNVLTELLTWRHNFRLVILSAWMASE